MVATMVLVASSASQHSSMHEQFAVAHLFSPLHTPVQHFQMLLHSVVDQTPALDCWSRKDVHTGALFPRNGRKFGLQ